MPISVASPRSLRGLAAPLRILVRLALALEGRRPGEIAIVLTRDASLRDLNRRYRGIDRATDVLSFGYEDSLRGGPGAAELPKRDPVAPPSLATLPDPATRAGSRRRAAGSLGSGLGRPRPAFRSARSRPAPEAPVSGDIVISLDRLDEQARRFRVSRGRELARLVVHGALHLAGLDHQRAAERRRMRRRESQALRAGRRAIVRLSGLASSVPDREARGSK